MSLSKYEIEVLNMSHSEKVKAFHEKLDQVNMSSALIGCMFSYNPYEIVNWCDYQKLVVIKPWSVYDPEPKTISYEHFLTAYKIYKFA